MVNYSGNVHNPIIQTDSDGDVTSVRLLDRALAPVDCALDRVEEFYAALRELLSLKLCQRWPD